MRKYDSTQYNDHNVNWGNVILIKKNGESIMSNVSVGILVVALGKICVSFSRSDPKARFSPPYAGLRACGGEAPPHAIHDLFAPRPQATENYVATH